MSLFPLTTRLAEIMHGHVVNITLPWFQEVFLDFSSFREAANTSLSRRFATRVFTASQLSRSSLMRRNIKRREKSRKTSGSRLILRAL